MSQYVMIILWLCFLTFLTYMMPVKKTVVVLENIEMRYRTAFVILTFVPLIIFCATRTHFMDTGAYIQGFHSIPDTISGMLSGLDEIEKDKGFYVLEAIIKIIFGDYVIIYFGIIAIIQGISLMKIYGKYSCDYLITLFIFVASTDYLSWMQNGMRQFTAVTIIFGATTWIIEKKYTRVIIIILLAATIHGSAVLMLPIIFVVQGKAWNKKMLLAVILIMIAIVFVDSFTNILDTLVSDTQYTNVVSDWQAMKDNGTSPFRVLVYSVPTILSFIGLRRIKKEDNTVINIACNMGILSTALYCLSMFTSGIFIGRLPIYCSLYSNGILLPWEIENMFTRDSKILVKILMVILYLIFYYYQTHAIWKLI